MKTPAFPLIRRNSKFVELLPKMTGAEVKVYCALAMHANKTQGAAFPKRETLRDATGLNIRTVGEATKGLERLGLVTKKRRKRTVEYCLEVQESCNSKPAQDVQDSCNSKDPEHGGDENQDVQVFSPRCAENLPTTSVNTPPNTPLSIRCADSGTGKPSASHGDLLRQAVLRCQGIAPGERVTQDTWPVTNRVVGELMAFDADPDDVPRRWAWIQENYPGASIHALCKHWTAAGRCMAQGITPAEAFR